MSASSSELNVRRMLRDAPGDDTFLLPSELFPSEVLAGQSQTAGPLGADVAAGPEADANGRGALIEKVARGLFGRRSWHVLVTGLRGVGKTTLVAEVAARAAAGAIPTLQGRRFLRVDVADVSPEESQPRFVAMLALLRDRQNLVLCLDGLGAMLRSNGGTTNKALLPAALRNSRIQVIGILSQWEFDELLGSEAEILELCTRVHVSEPDEETALDIVRGKASSLETDFNWRRLARASCGS